MAKTQAQRTQEYYERQKDLGRRQMKIWVYDDESLKAAIRKYANKKVKEYEKAYGIPS